MKPHQKPHLKVIPLGGLEQIGMNMTAFEYRDTIIVVDCGLAFPEDDMLGIEGVNASFVLYESNGIVNISARSMGAFNVQIVMEALGGGGHLTMAATQLKTDLNTAGRLLKDAIDDYIRNNG